MKRGILCAGSYGSKLQGNYHSLYFGNDLLIHDDRIPFDQLAPFYPPNTKEYSTLDQVDAIIPSSSLSIARRFGGGNGEYFWMDDKSLLHVCDGLEVQTFIEGQTILNSAGHEYILKYKDGSGSKGIYTTKDVEITVPDGWVAQEFFVGPEYVADVRLVGRKFWVSVRQSVERLEGRDVAINFNVPARVLRHVAKVLDTIRTLGVSEFFNIQLIEDEETGRIGVMEFDTRLSGSSICNTFYDVVMHRQTRENPDWTAHDSIFFTGEFNERAIDIYKDLGLSVPRIGE